VSAYAIAVNSVITPLIIKAIITALPARPIAGPTRTEPKFGLDDAHADVQMKEELLTYHRHCSGDWLLVQSNLYLPLIKVRSNYNIVCMIHIVML
jgi:hypothetical protein